MKHQSMPVHLQTITIAKFGYFLAFSTLSYLFLVKVVLNFHHTTIFNYLACWQGSTYHNGYRQLSSQHCERDTIYTMSLFIDSVIGEGHVLRSRIIEYYLGIRKLAKSNAHFVTVSNLLVHHYFKDVGVFFAL